MVHRLQWKCGHKQPSAFYIVSMEEWAVETLTAGLDKQLQRRLIAYSRCDQSTGRRMTFQQYSQGPDNWRNQVWIVDLGRQSSVTKTATLLDLQCLQRRWFCPLQSMWAMVQVYLPFPHLSSPGSLHGASPSRNLAING
jgi:hypothetical protein